MSEKTGLGPTEGAVWSRPAEWAARPTPVGCVICLAGEPLDVIAEFETCWATAGRSVALPGYVCVVARNRYNEPFDKPATEQALFWQETMLIAAAFDRVVPIKMNYEIRGNTLPHLQQRGTIERPTLPHRISSTRSTVRCATAQAARVMTPGHPEADPISSGR